MATNLELDNRIAVSPVEAARMIGICRSRIWDLLKAGEIEGYRDGKLRRITVDSLRARTARLLAEERAWKGEAA